MPSANTQLAFAIRAINESRAALNQVKDDLQTVTDKAEKGKGHLGGFGSALGNVAQIAGGFVLGSGILQAPSFLLSAAQAAADDEQSLNKLKQAVNNTGVSYDSLAGSLNDTIELAQKRAFTDDQARDALSLLTAQTGSATEAQHRFGLAMDLARGANIDVVTASRLLGKVTDENVNVLARYGIKVQQGASETELFGAIQEKFGGQAETFANSTAGHMEQVKIQMGELKEKIGYQLLPVMAALGDALVNDVIPAMNKAADWIELHLVPAVKEFVESQVVPQLEQAFAQLKQTWEGLQPAIDYIVSHKVTLVAAIIAITAAVAALTIAIYGPLAAIPLVIAAGMLLLANWDSIRNKAGELYDTIVEKVTGVITTVQGIPILGEIFTTVMNDIMAVVHFAWDDMKNKVETTINVVKDIIQIVTALIHGDWSEAWNGIRQLLSDVWDGIFQDIQLKLGLVKDLIWNGVQGFARSIGDGIGLMLDAGRALIQGLWDGATSLMGQVEDWFRSAPWLIASALGDTGRALLSAGWWLIQGLWDGIKQRATQLWDDLAGLAGDILGAIKDPLGIFSPSKAFEEIGRNIIEGLSDGLQKNAAILQQRIEELKVKLVGISDPAMRDRIINEIKELMAKLAEVLGQPLPAPGGGSWPPGGVPLPKPPLPEGPLPGKTPVKGSSGGTLGPPLSQVLAGNEIWAVASALFSTFEGVATKPVNVINSRLHNMYGSLEDMRGIIAFSKFIAPNNISAFFSKLTSTGVFDQGGWLMPGLTLAMNRTGRPERVSPGGGDIIINISAIDGESVRRIAPQLASEIQRHLRSQGAVGMVV